MEGNVMAKAAKTTALANIDKGKEALQAVSKLSGDIRGMIENGDEIERAVAVASGVVQLADALTDDAVALLMRLQGHELGFKTDRDRDGGYTPDVVKQIAVRALLHGAHLTSNEWNIIASGCYLTKNFYLRKLREYPGLTDLRVLTDAPTEPTQREKMVRYRVGGSASCKVDGKPVALTFDTNGSDNRAIVEVFDSGTAIDGALGKAEKRFAKILYGVVAGVEITEGAEAASVTVIEPDTEPARDWTAEINGAGVAEQATLIKNAPRKQDRDEVLAAAETQNAAGTLSDDQLKLLREYAATRN